MYVSLILFMLYYVSDPIPPKTDDPLLRSEYLEELQHESATEDLGQKVYKGTLLEINRFY